MIKKIFYSSINICCFILLYINLQAQVKTKIYFDGIPNAKINNTVINSTPIEITAPPIFDKLLNKGAIEDADVREYKERFAVIVSVDIDFIKAANRVEENGFVVYYLSLTAKKALNLSLQFNEFSLSKNSVLSIFNTHEITDSITAKENNPNNIWATRIYQGDRLYLVLKTPKNEEGLNKLKINQMGLGYKKVGGDFFGNPGASATCNINVLCPQGNGWENERNSVAILLVANGTATCTGTLTMNTCGTNVPYLLTANHCLGGNLLNWVFQFQYWSSTCNPNGTYREDIQFNGCQLRANNAATDFALVELNQIPQPNSGITYSGWTRSTTPATSATGIHHPMGDLMKISHDFNPLISVTYPGSGGNNHWRASFDQGIVQHGSSGSALYDQNHRIVGQLHGNQNNICFPGQDNCWCITQIPSIGEYGRFDISWTGGGTNASRLSNWLDPTNTGAITTNTTDILNLTPAISGNDGICLPATTGTYTAINLPTCGTNTVNWTKNVSQVTISPLTGLSTTVSTNGYEGLITLTATVTNSNGFNTTLTKTIRAGNAPSCSTRTAYWYVNGYQTVLNKCTYLTEIRCTNGSQNILSLCDYYANAWVTDPTADKITWSYVSSSGYAFWNTNGNQVEVTINTNTPNGWIRLKCTTENACGSYNWDFWFTPQGSTASCPVYLDITCFDSLPKPISEKISLSPNPTNGQFIISLTSTDKNAVIKEVIIHNKMGIPVFRQKFANMQKTQVINLFGKPTDIYTIQVFDGKEWLTKKLSLRQ